MATIGQARATLDDLYREPGKAELIGGRIVKLMATGHMPNRVAGRIFRSLDDYADQTSRGVAYTDNMGFAVPELPSGRESFSPDAACYAGPLPRNQMRFAEGPPTLAVEVRSEGDYIPSAEIDIAAKRADYFAARIDVYRADAPNRAVAYRRGDTAEAEPAVPGWRVAVDWIFR